MNVDESAVSAHEIKLTERHHMTLSGIGAVDGFDTESVVMRTSSDGLSVQGHELHIDRFDSDTGRLEISGTIDALVYFDMKRHKRTDGKRGKQSLR
ncbi:MAG: sporulation protein YabP [Firmicutes bacterium]|nr:sporulation protein YabP [Bacillota bacterium]MCD7943478.1 sporulation protein YabP [Clostridia bacterium]MCD8055183.1 sporulation protein YabP [Clostridiales bacterium]MCD7747803.1 sporulation protein YabP [Bacillota bacterium]MCD7783853.1 sporulation protein YabP [Bacillota bacterium]